MTSGGGQDELWMPSFDTTDSEVEDDTMEEPWAFYVRQDKLERRLVKERRLEKRLREDFPQFQDDVCRDIIREVCDSHTGEGGVCCLEKRRRIMEDAAPLADAWESADKLKKMFMKNAVPVHFQKVIAFLAK